MIRTKDMMLISCLRQDARMTLTNISKKTKIPISTLYDRLKVNDGGIIKKHTAILDFAKLGFNTRATIVMKVDKDDRDLIKDALMKNSNMNSVFKINNGFDFMVEGIFKDIREVEEFIERLESNFKITNYQVYYIIDEIEKEAFLSNQDHAGMAFGK